MRPMDFRDWSSDKIYWKKQFVSAAFKTLPAKISSKHETMAQKKKKQNMKELERCRIR